MSDYVVYVHQNKINGKRYIGITNNTSKRWYGKGKRYENCPHFATALRKYGWDNFHHVVIVQNLSLDEANVLEQYYIAMYRTQDKRFGYNMTKGGTNAPTMAGKRHSAETRQKMRQKALGRKISEEQRKAHSKWMSENFRGKRNSKSTPVRCINTGEVFETQRAAAEAKGVQQAKISLCCSGKRSHTQGLMWEFVKEMEV